MSQDLYRFYLLEKKASSYAFIGHAELNGPPDHTVDVIEAAARALIHSRLGLSAVGIKLDVYQATPISHLFQTLTHGSLATAFFWG